MSKWFTIQSANGEFCQYGSFEDCARAERAKFAEELQTREQVDAGQFLDGVSPNSRQLIFQNLSKIALTKGCNGRCSFCSVCANPGITKQLSYDSVAPIIAEFHQTHAADYNRRTMLEPFLDSELLDWGEVDGNGSITRDFRDILECLERSLVKTPQDHPNTNGLGFTKFMTHVPPHSAEALLEFLSNTKSAQEYEDDVIKPFISLRISQTENNKELVSRLKEKLMKRLIARYGMRSNTQQYEKDMSVEIGSEDDNQAGSHLCHIGRNYPGDSTPIEELDVGPVHSEGVMLTPDGFVSRVWVLPTDDNPRGVLEIPFSEDTGVIARYDPRMKHLDNIKSKRGTPEDGIFQCLMPTLRDTLIATNDHAIVEDYLTPRNEILREAAVWNSFECGIKTHKKLDKIIEQYSQPEYYQHIMERLAQTNAILDTHAGEISDDDRVVKYLRETKARLNQLLGLSQFDDFAPSDFTRVYHQLSQILSGLDLFAK